MATYLLMFSISCCIFFCIRKHSLKTKEFILGSIVGLALPCIVAGLRAETIGTDVLGYIRPLFNYARESNNITEYFSKYWSMGYRNAYVTDYEIGFRVLVYLVQKIFNSIHILLFLIQALVVVPIYCSLTNSKVKEYAWFGMLVYYLMYYNASLNMMRQWIAMGVLMCGLNSLLKRNYKRYIIWILLAMLFHKSAIIGLGFICIMIFISYRKEKRLYILSEHIRFSGVQVKCLAIFVLGIGILYSNQIVLMVLNVVGFSGYSQYFDGTPYLMPSQFLIRIPIIFIAFSQWKRIKENETESAMYLAMLFCDLVFANYSSLGSYMWRMAIWFGYYNIYLCPLIVSSCVKTKKYIVELFLGGYLIVYWLFYFGYKGIHETVPYISMFSI